MKLFGFLQTKDAATYTSERGSTGTTALTMGVAARDDGTVCAPASTCMGQDPLCNPASLSVGLDLTFKTAGGTFDEAFPVSASRVDATANVIWSGSLAATALKGTSHVTQGTPAQVTLTFEASFNCPATGATFGEVGEETSTVSAGSGTW